MARSVSLAFTVSFTSVSAQECGCFSINSNQYFLSVCFSLSVTVSDAIEFKASVALLFASSNLRIISGSTRITDFGWDDLARFSSVSMVIKFI